MFRSALKRSCLTVGVVATGVSCSWFSSAERERELPPLAIDVAEGEVITAQSQYFETGSANVSKDGIRYLEAVSEELVNSYESGEYTGPICIEGHSDSRGPTSQNMALSQRRADEVERILKGEKVENPITAVGKGESESTNVDSYQKARRVDITLASCEDKSVVAQDDGATSTTKPPSALVNGGQENAN